jgi:hypothetical protein
VLISVVGIAPIKAYDDNEHTFIIGVFILLFNMKPFLQSFLKTHFPQPIHAFGYGSAVFQQANYKVDTPS